MKILAITGSPREASFNTALLQAIRTRAKAPLDITIHQGLNKLPVFQPYSETAKTPEAVQQFITSIAQSAGVIISTPEYAHGIPGGLKNALDWVVDAAELVLKPVAVMSVSTSGLGGYRSHAALIQVLTAMNWNVVIESSINVPYASMRFDKQRQLNDDLTCARIDLALRAFQRAIVDT